MLVGVKTTFISPLGVRITIPEKYSDKITIRTDAAEKQITFLEFDTSIYYSDGELFSLRVHDKEEYTAQEGFGVLKSSDYKAVTALDKNELCPTRQEFFKAVEIV